MEDKHGQNGYIYFLENDNTSFIVIRYFKNILEKIEKKINKHVVKNKLKTLVFDLWDINDFLENKDNKSITKIIDIFQPNSLVIKHCPIKEEFFFYQNENNLLELNELYVTDELYTMSPCLNKLFNNIKTEKLQLRKIKINSKDQLNNFFNFITKIECEELILDDIFIELLIKTKKDEDDNDTLEQYFSFDLVKGKIIIINKKENTITKIKKLKLIDCPLFCLPDDDDNEIETLKYMSEFKDISLDIDENSLLNPGMITKIKMENGLFDICFDLDSFKLNLEDNKDYLKYLNDIFDLVSNNNCIYRKIKFKNFDVTKSEYVIGYNNHTIEEERLILNEKEQKAKKNFEEKDKEIKDKIKNKKLENIKELIFDNCSNSFIEIVLSMIKKEHLIDLLKIKKCANEYFIFNNLFPLKIKHLYLFDVPIKYNPDAQVKQKVEKGELTLKIVSLEHYCKENDLNFYFVMENIRKLLKETERETICFEMNALPNLINFLLAEQYNKDNDNDKKEIKQYYPIKKEKDKVEIDRETQFKNIEKIENLKNKKIILKRNNIRNNLENYYYFMKLIGNKFPEKEDKHKKDVSDHGKEMAYLDKDYATFLDKNEINEITIENCLFTNLDKTYLISDDLKTKIEENNKSTILNFIEGNNKREYKIDMKTLKEILLRNNKIDDFAHLMKMKLKDFKNLLIPGDLFGKLNKRITIVINNIQELKEFYCLSVLIGKENELKYVEEDKKEIRLEEDESFKKMRNYFIKEKSYEPGEKITNTIFNYYYSSGDELKKELDKTIQLIKNNKFEIKVDVKDNKDFWNIIYQ